MLKDAVKQAFLNNDFELGSSLVKQWGASVKAEMMNAACQEDLRRIVDDALSYAEGNLYLARVMRAHVATELRSNSASFLYRQTELEQHRWHVKA